MAHKRAMSQREVDALKTPGMTCVWDNLYLQIRDQGTRSWLFRYWVDRKPNVIGRGCGTRSHPRTGPRQGRTSAPCDQGRGRSRRREEGAA